MKKCQKVRKSAKNYETILPFSCCPLVFPWFRRTLSAIGPYTNFGGNSYGPIIGPCLFLGKFVWTNGPESSSKVSPYIGIGPWMALPSKVLVLKAQDVVCCDRFRRCSRHVLAPWRVSPFDRHVDLDHVFGHERHMLRKFTSPKRANLCAKVGRRENSAAQPDKGSGSHLPPLTPHSLAWLRLPSLAVKKKIVANFGRWKTFRTVPVRHF